MNAESPRKFPQKLVISHAATSPYGPHAFRDHMETRDLGVAEATNGAIAVYLTRARGPFDPAAEAGAHYHLPDFQYFYVLTGWQRMHFEGHGEVMFTVGSGWLQERGIRHTVLDRSPDLEVLAIALPSQFETVEA